MISLYELKYFEIRIHIKKHQLQYRSRTLSVLYSHMICAGGISIAHTLTYIYPGGYAFIDKLFTRFD